MKFEIKNRWSGELIFSVEADNWRLAITAAIGAKANLSFANLSFADLSFANLSFANLSFANLSFANLRSADLSSADLRFANLRSANLRSANLSFANLRSADLSSADLSFAIGLEKFPISIMGHRHSMFTTADGKLQIGCHVHTFKEWERHAEKIGDSEGYSPIDIEIYKLHIAHIAKVSELLWNRKEKK